MTFKVNKAIFIVWIYDMHTMLACYPDFMTEFFTLKEIDI